MNKSFQQVVSVTAFAVALVLPGVAGAKVSEQTLKNLNTAFQGESNAANRYGKFAVKAAAEGNAQVAKLFRAAAASEAIHRDTHKKAIAELGGTAKEFELDAVTPGTTAENLKASIKGETYERDTMYPDFLAVAKADDAAAAIRTIEFALAAEKEHAKLYQEALDNLGKNAKADYFVCGVCGMTVTELPAKKCRSCRQSVDKYNKIA
ncbi:MAG: rubrerythrin family protein [Verrucomicrobia bacterium]|nr:rubrerythrin family protein [Verrucomicrobiota bacterium]